MSNGINDYKKAVCVLKEYPELARFVGPRSKFLVDQAESALGAHFPPSYRQFLLDLGAGGFGGEEFYGIIDNNFEASAVPNGIWLNLDERKRGYLPKHLIAFYSTGDGAYYALDVSRTDEANENPVVEWISGLMNDRSTPTKRAESFGEFFLHSVLKAVRQSTNP